MANIKWQDEEKEPVTPKPTDQERIEALENALLLLMMES